MIIITWDYRCNEPQFKQLLIQMQQQIASSFKSMI